MFIWVTLFERRLLPTLIFTVIHGVVSRPVAFVTIFFFGLFAIVVVLDRQSLWLICGIHAGWNWALGNVFGLQVSGPSLETNALFFVEAAPGQPEWLTGGRFGTEGSLIASFMIITATGPGVLPEARLPPRRLRNVRRRHRTRSARDEPRLRPGRHCRVRASRAPDDFA